MANVDIAIKLRLYKVNLRRNCFLFLKGEYIALSIVNNFESDKSFILGIKLNLNKWVNLKIYLV